MNQMTSAGFAALERGDWETAEMAFSKVLEKDARNLEANLGMGLMALKAGYPEDVAAFVQASRTTDSRLAELAYSASIALGKQEEALKQVMFFLAKQPAVALRLRVGSDLLAAARFAEALDLFRDGRRHDSSNHLMHAGEAAACQMLGRIDDCRRAIERRMRLLPNDCLVHSHWIALHAGKISLDEQQMFSLAAKWDERFGTAPKEFHAPPQGKRVSCAEERLRVGFVSSTFRHHANCQFLLPLLENLDRSSLAVFAYYDGSKSDHVTERCRAAVDFFQSIHGMPELRVAELIRSDRIDVLIDINAHFDDARLQLFTFRAAPVQVHYLGGIDTTGLRAIDWRIVDAFNAPLDEQMSAEKPYLVGGGIHAFHPLCDTAPPNPLPLEQNGYVTFGCLNALAKMEDPVLDLWARCLKAVPHSRLRLIKDAFRHHRNSADFAKRAARRGIDPTRLELLSASSDAFDDLSVYHGIDIALDTFAYNGITTTCEALWMGVPVVTLLGNRFVAREAAGILTRCGHPEWIGDSADAYLAVATTLASDPKHLAKIRKQLRAEFIRSPIHDAKRLASAFEKFLFSVF